MAENPRRRCPGHRDPACTAPVSMTAGAPHRGRHRASCSRPARCADRAPPRDGSNRSAPGRSEAEEHGRTKCSSRGRCRAAASRTCTAASGRMHARCRARMKGIAAPSNSSSPRIAAAGRLQSDGRPAHGAIRRPTRAHPPRAPTRCCASIEDALLPAARAMANMGEQQRVRETRCSFRSRPPIVRRDDRGDHGPHAYGRSPARPTPTPGVAMKSFIFEPERRRDGRLTRTPPTAPSDPAA